MTSCGVRTYPLDFWSERVPTGGPRRDAGANGDAGPMIDAFVVEVGALCEEPGEQLGTLVAVQRTQRFRISALSSAAAETAGMQLFSAEATRQRRLVRDAWVHAGLPDAPALH